MAFHVRSNSLPSKPHPEVANIEDHIIRLKSSQEASVSASTLCRDLDRLKNLHEDVNNLIQLPSIQKALLNENRANELLNGSLKLVDICGVLCDVICLTKESVQELQSSLRRNRGIGAYVSSRKNIDKMVKKCIKNLKSFNQCSVVSLDGDNDIKSTAAILKELQVTGLSVLKSKLTIFASKPKKTWSLVSNFTETQKESSAKELYASNVNKLQRDIATTSIQNVMKQLNATEMTIQELEENLEAFLRSSVKIRVSLLDVLSH